MFHVIFYQPIFNLLIGFYDLLPFAGIGLAIILLTVIIKLILWPLAQSALKQQKAMQELQPKLEDIKKRYADDKERLAKETMALYSHEKVNPASSCLPVLIQLPVFIALYQALSSGLKSSGWEALYPFVPNPGAISTAFLGLDLSKPSWLLAILAGISQYFQAKMMVTKPQPKVEGGKDEAMMAQMNRNMMYMMPFMTVFISWNLPGGLALYWLVMTLLTIVQQRFVLKPSASSGGTPGSAGGSSGLKDRILGLIGGGSPNRPGSAGQAN